MPRDLPLGNGSLLVNFDQQYRLRDVYWPHVGQENHTVGHPFRFGVWVEGQFSWVESEAWSRTLDYERDTLVSEVTLHNPHLSLHIVCRDTVDFHEDLYLRKLVVENQAEREREVRLFFSHDFHISGNEVGDTAYYEPERKAVYHYKGRRWFMINAAKAGSEGWTLGIDQWATGKTEIGGREGTWRDAEDGVLSGHAIEQGSVDSTVALHLTVPERGQAVGWYWIAVGEDFPAVTRINREIRRKDPDTFLARTRDYWRLWISKEERELCDLSSLLGNLFRRSLLILRTQIDNQGGIVAANDSDITHYAADTYSYVWPRDGALVAATLIDEGYSMVTRRFFQFCHRVITEEGYLLHKYNPDSSLASSWHGWYVDGEKKLPVQEDETALVLWALWRHFQRFRDVEYIKPHYRGLITRAANWLARFRDEQTGLPLPSWDLWEERRGVHAWTVGATWAGLEAAARFADAFGERRLAETYGQAAKEIRSAAEEYLWLPDQERFARTITRTTDGWEADRTVDASLVGLWYFHLDGGDSCLFTPDDPRVTSTMRAVRDRLSVEPDVIGVARYENDRYHQVSSDTNRVPGNPWFISTLWLAQWEISMAEKMDDLHHARDRLEWAASHALSSGVMAEQVHPYTHEPLSVSPLTWSHATLVSAARQYVDKWRTLQGA
jgi:GH15 family glucan-1,4-alpha-glucosidase